MVTLFLGKPHDSPEHVDYVPSIFPAVYKRSKRKTSRRVLQRLKEEKEAEEPEESSSSETENEQLKKIEEVIRIQEYLMNEDSLSSSMNSNLSFSVMPVDDVLFTFILQH